jgi:hypothetical protein
MVARGARKPTSRLAAVTEPLTAGRFTFSKSRKRRYLISAQPESGSGRLRLDYARLLAGLSLAELYSAVMPWEHPADAEYEELRACLALLTDHPSIPAAYAWSALRCLNLAGALPDFSSVEVILQNGERRAWVSPSHGGSWSAGDSVPPDRFLAKYESIVALAKLSGLAHPPSVLRDPVIVLETLAPFVRHVAELELPAVKQLTDVLRVDLTPSGSNSAPLSEPGGQLGG